jgi:stage II sporulation protein D
LFFIIFLQVVVNLFSKYNIQEITIKIPSKKEVNINKNSTITPYYKLPNNSKIIINKNKIKSVKGNIFIKKLNNKFIIFQKIEINEYVLSVLNSEIDKVEEMPIEALKAFYLVIKNYTLTHLRRHKKINVDFCDNAHCQLYYGNVTPQSSIKENLESLFEKKIYYKNKLTITPYSSSCGQYTCNSETIWNKAYPYLKGIKLNTNFDKWTYKISKKDLIRIAGINSINKLIIKNGCVLNGENFRRKINLEFGWNKIKSNVFTTKQYKNYYLISGSGFGHNFGFCIKEAIYLANQGMNYKQILKYFFKDIEIR